MVVRRPHVIDLFDSRTLHGFNDGAKIALTGVSGIDEKRFTSRAHEECRVAAFCIDVVEIQLCSGTLGKQNNDSCCEKQYCREDTAHRSSPCWPRIIRLCE